MNRNDASRELAVFTHGTPFWFDVMHFLSPQKRGVCFVRFAILHLELAIIAIEFILS